MRKDALTTALSADSTRSCRRKPFAALRVRLGLVAVLPAKQRARDLVAAAGVTLRPRRDGIYSPVSQPPFLAKSRGSISKTRTPCLVGKI